MVSLQLFLVVEYTDHLPRRVLANSHHDEYHEIVPVFELPFLQEVGSLE